MSIYRKRFGLAHDPLPRDCVGKTFYADERYERLRKELVELEEEREQQTWQRRPRRHRR